MRVLVVGAGTMGRWVGATLDGPVAFADVDQEAAAAAARAIDGAITAPLEVLPDEETDPGQERQSFDTVVVAVPMTAADDVINSQADRATAAIVDVAGEMTGPIEAMRTAAPDLERLSLHPLFAPENAPGTIAAVHDEPGPVTNRIREALSVAGNDVFETTVTEHDEAMESVQAATHAAILAWRLAADDDVRAAFHTPLSSELEALAEHVTSQEPRVYADIATRYGAGTDALADAAETLSDADRTAFLDAFERASARSPTEREESGNEGAQEQAEDETSR